LDNIHRVLMALGAQSELVMSD